MAAAQSEVMVWVVGEIGQAWAEGESNQLFFLFGVPEARSDRELRLFNVESGRDRGPVRVNM